MKQIRNYLAPLFVMIVFAQCGGTRDTRDIPENVIAWWPGDGNSREIVNHEKGEWNGPSAYEPGVSGSAFSFDGTDAMISAGFDETGPMDEFTLEMWVRHVDFYNFALIYARAGGGCIDEMGRTTRIGSGPGGSLEFLVARVSNDDFPVVLVYGVLDADVYHHVAGTYSREGLFLYRDGLLVGHIEEWDGPYCFTWMDIGGGSLDGQMNGLIDEVRLHNRALDASEIEAIFRAKFPDREPRPVPEEQDPDLIRIEFQGFPTRHEEDYPYAAAKDLLDGLKQASVELLPTFVRAPEGVYSESESASILTDFLESNGYASVQLARNAVMLPEPQGEGQFEVFNTGLNELKQYVDDNPLASDYLMMVEVIILSPDEDSEREGVWGVHFYVVGPEGNDAFSVILNSHWALLNDADLWGERHSETERRTLVDGAVRLATEALLSHLRYVRNQPAP